MAKTNKFWDWLWSLWASGVRCDGGMEGTAEDNKPEPTVAAIGWFYDSPDAGDPACVCSFCGLVITVEDAPPVRMWDPDERMEARFHMGCWTAISPDTIKPVKCTCFANHLGQVVKWNEDCQVHKEPT